MASKKYRNYTFVCYPDSYCYQKDRVEYIGFDSPLAALKELGVDFVMSPLHDKDIDDDGDPKKAHYHVALLFNGPIQRNTALDLVHSIGGVEPRNVGSLDKFVIRNLRSTLRYFCHLDNPEKYEYNILDVVCYGDIDYIQQINLSSDRYQLIGDMMDYCRENYIYSFAMFCIYCKDNNQEWFRALCDHAGFIMKEFLKSLHWDHKSEESIDV